jgi:hypothetical protein
MWHPVWEPLWQAVNEVNLPLNFHTFPSLPPDAREKATGLTRRAALFTGVSGFQMNLVNILAAVIGAAVLERYPNLRIVFGLQLFCFGAGALYLGRIGGALLTAVKVPKAAQQQDAEPTLERLSFPSPREQPKPQGLGSQTIDDDQQVG